MNKSITTSQLPPIEEHKARPAVILTSNKVQPNRNLDVSNEERRRFTGTVITSHNIEQIQEENRKAAELAEATTTKKAGGKKEK